MLTQDRAEHVARVFASVGEPTRVRLLNALQEGDFCVRDLIELLGVAQPTISRHLARLRETGLVRAQRVGRCVCYGLADPLDPLLRGVLAVMATAVGNDDPLASERRDARDRHHAGSCR